MSEFPPITELVPHLEPMLAIEELVAWSEEHAESTMELRAENPFVHDGRFDASCTLEFMAQTIAAWLGMKSYRGGVDVGNGMVVACRELVIERSWLAVGERLRIGARRLRGDAGVGVFEAEVHDGRGELVARATLTLVHGPAPD